MTRTPEQTTDLLPLTLAFLADVEQETKRARAKFPLNRHMLAAFTEESGEVAQAFLENHYGDKAAIEVWKECVQAAAMALRCAVEGDHSFDYKPPSIDTRTPAAAMPEQVGDVINTKNMRWLLATATPEIGCPKQFFDALVDVTKVCDFIEAQPQPAPDTVPKAVADKLAAALELATEHMAIEFALFASFIAEPDSVYDICTKALTEYQEAMQNGGG